MTSKFWVFGQALKLSKALSVETLYNTSEEVLCSQRAESFAYKAESSEVREVPSILCSLVTLWYSDPIICGGVVVPIGVKEIQNFSKDVFWEILH